MKNLLMIAFHFPPMAGSGYLRTLKFCSYLPQGHWTPHVLTVKESAYHTRDMSMVAQIPSATSVTRTISLNTRTHLSIRGKYPSILTIPDPCVGWLPFAVLSGTRVIRRERIRALYSTSPIPTAHLIGLVLKRLTRLPWIADFRDPWVETETSEHRGRLQTTMDRRLERIVVRNADRVVATTESLRQQIAERHKDLDPDRFVTIHNGYDHSDFEQLPSRQPEPGRPFTLLHAGMVNGTYRNPEPLVLALKSLLEEGKIRRGDIVLRFLGSEKYLRGERFQSTLRAHGLEDMVEITGHVGYEQCLRELACSQVLLLLQGGSDTRTLIPAKAFEYLRIGRPILALTLEGETASLVRRFHAGLVVPPDDATAAKNAIFELYSRHKNGDLQVSIDEDQLREYSREALTRKLVHTLNEVAGNKP